jgi:hypothetical protein
MYWLDGGVRICIVSGYFYGTLEGGRTGDNLEIFRQIFGLFLVFYLIYYFIIHIHA